MFADDLHHAMRARALPRSGAVGDPVRRHRSSQHAAVCQS
jgi:hypothetical protein